MRQPLGNDDNVYEVAIYNRDVRALVKDNKSHTLFDDTWADSHIQDVVACDEAAARAAIAERFPPTDGFVVVSINLASQISVRVGNW